MSDYVRMADWHKDHWSLLAYIETVCVECGGFQVGLDPHMRQNRHNYRVMYEECRRPRRPSHPPIHGCMWESKYTTRIRTGVTENHDDWCCVQDMAVEGLFADRKGNPLDVSGIDPGVILHLSQRAQILVEQIRRHKAAGGTFAQFEPKAGEDAAE